MTWTPTPSGGTGYYWIKFMEKGSKKIKSDCIFWDENFQGHFRSPFIKFGSIEAARKCCKSMMFHGPIYPPEAK